MIKKAMITAAVALFAAGFLSAPAQAGHCPKDVKKINAAMSKLDKNKMTMAKDAADKGLALHKAKKHGESIKVLHAAMEKYGIKH
jgi:outer membrane lipoprotein-sorting protein